MLKATTKQVPRMSVVMMMAVESRRSLPPVPSRMAHVATREKRKW